MKKQEIDIAAYVWPAYSNNAETKIFWEQNCGEWQSVMSAKPKFEGHRQPRIPLLGYVDEANPDVMEMEINIALRYNVNVFIYDWYYYNGSVYLEDCLQKGFLKAKNCKDMLFYLMYSNHDVNGVWKKEWTRTEKWKDTIWSAKITREQWRFICGRWIDEYFTRGNYYKIGGKPVLMIYDLNNFIDSFSGVYGAVKQLDYLQNTAVKKGLKGVHIQAALRRLPDSADGLTTGIITAEQLKELQLDSVTYYHYVLAEHLYDKVKYIDYAKHCADGMEKTASRVSTAFIPHVSLGWDNNARYVGEKYTDIILEASKEDIAEMVNRAKNYINEHSGCPGLITVNSWNEWTEGSYLMPDTHNKYAYLEAIKETIGKL